MNKLLKKLSAGIICLGLCTVLVSVQALADVVYAGPEVSVAQTASSLSCSHDDDCHDSDENCRCDTTITLSNRTCTYDGKAHTCGTACVNGSSCKVTYTYYSDKACTHKLSCAPTKPGTYYVKAHVAADDNYNAATSKVAVLTITKAKQCITVHSCSHSCHASSCKKSSCRISLNVTAKGKVTCKKLSGSSRLTISSSGRITVKKGTGKGTYRMKVKFHAASTSCYKSANVSKTIKVVVK